MKKTFPEKIALVIAAVMVAGLFSPFINLFQTRAQQWLLVLIVFIIFVTYAVIKQQKKEKEYESRIEKRLRAEQKIREKLDREFEAKSSK